MALSSKPNMGSQHHIYVSFPGLTQRARVHSLEGAEAVCATLLSRGIGSGDAVFVSTFAHPRVAEAITRSEAEPIFVDVTLETWHVSAEVLDMAAQWCLSVGTTPKALVMVDTYGLRFDTEALRDVCWKYDMVLIEDHRAGEGRADLRRLPAVVARRSEIHARYRRGLEGSLGLRFTPGVVGLKADPWMTCVVFEEFDMRNRVLAGLEKFASECRHLWRPLHTLPAYAHATAIVDGTAEYLFEHGLCLPSSSTLTNDQVDAVIETIVAVVG